MSAPDSPLANPGIAAPRSGGSAPFPRLRIGPDGFRAEGAFAESQAVYLEPDPDTVRDLDELLAAQNTGVVAHFYMDPELQGVLTACSWPHVHISDSLAMADKAIAMAEAGVRQVVVLGVDFMSENVRAMLDAAGFPGVPVYRVATEAIGCSLAESAEADAYDRYLERAAATPRSLHVVYINTSLRTKARAHAKVPTLTVTSSNVVKATLQAFAQVDGLHVWFGPDTYMGRNLRNLFESLADLDEARVRALHPAHTPATVRRFLDRFHHFEEGVCIVHHMFGAEVAERVRREHPDAFVTAHLEVPGEMFAVGLERQAEDRGVVGSTSNILAFITRKVHEAVDAGRREPLSFVLGTEAGMVTAIAKDVRRTLREAGPAAPPVDIVFPVASDAIAATPDPELAVVPGVLGGEGCSTAGGCATCPYMKMNSLDALISLLERTGKVSSEALSLFFPKQYVERIDGRTMADLGGEPILHMRDFQRFGELSDRLVRQVVAGAASASPQADHADDRPS
jgi:quinolinate synthase